MHYFTLIETQPTFKTAELLRTNLDCIRLPREIVKEIMKGYKLEETIWKERKKEKDWGKNEACYNLVGSRLKFFCFRFWGPMQKGIGRMGTRNSDIRSTSAAFNSYFLNNFFGKGIRWISMERLLTFFFLIIVIKILLVFDVRSFLTKLCQFAQVFSQECFFGRKSFLMKTLMTWTIFFKNFTKVVFCSKNAKWSLNLTRFCVSKAENSSDPQRKNYEFSSFQVAKMSVTKAKIIVT